MYCTMIVKLPYKIEFHCLFVCDGLEVAAAAIISMLCGGMLLKGENCMLLVVCNGSISMRVPCLILLCRIIELCSKKLVSQCKASNLMKKCRIF